MSTRLRRWAVGGAVFALYTLSACSEESAATPDQPSLPSAAGAPAPAPAQEKPGNQVTPVAPPATPAEPQPAKNEPKPEMKPEPAAMPSTPSAATMAEPPEGFMADAGDGWKTLVTGRWEVPANDEVYICTRFTVPQDVTIAAFRALSPPGTHHTFLSVVDSPTVPDGTGKCSAMAGGSRNIAGSGVGTDDFQMPAGVGIELKAGQQLVLNLHLFNTGDKPIRGLSGTLIKPVAPSEVKHLAEGFEAGTTSLKIPPGGPTTQSGTCTMTHDVKLIAAGPHMHQLGVYLKAVAHSSVMGDVVLIDAPYSFDEQSLKVLPREVEMKKGDTITVDCTYKNTTDREVKFGESTLSEMCFAGLYRYPAGSGSVICVR